MSSMVTMSPGSKETAEESMSSRKMSDFDSYKE
jgi:hypothetical protein